MKARSKAKLSLVHSVGSGRALQPLNDATRVAAAFRALANRAERGELVGSAVVVWTNRDCPEMRIVGHVERDLIKAHYGASLLVDSLLHFND